MSDNTIALQLIGYGNMGKVILRSLHAYSEQHPAYAFSVAVLDRKPLGDIGEDFPNAYAGVDPSASVIILAVKPQQLAQVDLTLYDTQATCISVLAGTTIATLEKKYPFATIVRCMPNMLLSLGLGHTGRYQQGESTEAKLMKEIFSHMGSLTTYERESQLDDHTALFGSGPAFVAMVVELLVKAAGTLDIDLSASEKRQLITQMFLGSCMYMEQEGIDTQTFMQRVMSPGGTTQAFREKLQELGGEQLFAHALLAAQKRAQTL